MIGRELAQYRLVERLGIGGMGEVFLADDTRLERQVAIKVLHPKTVAERERLLIEARAASALHHPNVAHVYEIGEADGIPFIAMKHVRGKLAPDHSGPLLILAPSYERKGDLLALQSAVQRLPLGVVTFDSKGNIRMMNRAASMIFECEGIPMDVKASRPSHPISRLLAVIFEGTETTRQIVTLASGDEYEIEPSHRSEKEGDRLVMLLMRKLAGGAVMREPSVEDWELTRREQEVARELTAGRSSREMTESLGISPETLKSHLANMMRKTQTRSQAELVVLLLRGR